MTFGSRLKQYRTQLNITQKELAEQMNVTFQTVSKWESDINEPDFASVRKLAQILGCSIDDLLSDDEPAEETEQDEESTDEEDEEEQADDDEEDGDYDEQDDESEPEAKVIDTCRDCRASIREGEIVHHVERKTASGVKEIVTVCDACFKKREEQMNRRAKEIEDSLKPKPKEEKKGIFNRIADRNDKKPLIWAIVLGAVAAVAGAVTSIWGHETLGLGLSIALPFLSGYCVMAVVYCIFAGSYIRDVFAWVASWSIKFPGLIWQFSLEGFMWLIGMKILFAVLGALISVAVFLLALGIAIVLSIVSFIPVLIYNKTHYEG